MKLAFVVNDTASESAIYSTSSLALTAMNMGHQVWYISVEDLSYASDDRIYAKATRVEKQKYPSEVAFIRTLHSEQAIDESLVLDELDVLWLRSDPADDAITRPWAKSAGIYFGRLAMRHGVLVLNDPNGLSIATNKMYLQYFPEEVRPRTIITRDPADIKHFIQQEGGYTVLKPLSGSGGHNVFLIQPYDQVNLNQIIEAVSAEGYIIAQEYLPEAAHGDTRMFLLNGKPLHIKNKYAAIKRARRAEDIDMRSNIRAGAIAQKGEVTQHMLELAEIIRPKLTIDGMFLVGLDIVGNKLMEINVFSPGCLRESEHFEKTEFCAKVIRSIEKKVEAIGHYKRIFDNAEIAMF